MLCVAKSHTRTEKPVILHVNNNSNFIVVYDGRLKEGCTIRDLGKGSKQPLKCRLTVSIDKGLRGNKIDAALLLP